MSFKYILSVVVLFIIAVTAASPARAQEYTSQNLFYLVGSPQSYESFVKNADQISIVCPAAYSVDRYGVVSGFIDPRVLKIAGEKGIKVMPLVALGDQSSIHDLLTSSAARAEAIRLMLFYAHQFSFYGWQLDLENILFTDRGNYTDFYRQAADSLHKHDLKISMAVVKSDQPAPEEGNPGFQRYRYETSRGAFDIPAIAKAGDFISVMAYDQHTSLTPPGPVAGLPWVKGIINYLLKSGVPADKISLGVPTYSDYWYPAWNEQEGARSTRAELSFHDAQNLLDEFGAKERWMKSQEVNYAYWEEGGIFNWLFMEDARSFAPKVELVKKYHLLGMSVWLLGLEDPATWGVLRNEVKTERIK
ncbi:MAG: glycosyl hydrolase family 18 protein [Bacteroidetes bacterium]|nr:glycosyl hydrolase family 18 protein [Bacteroidota bacterium]